MVDHTAMQLTLRARAVALVVCTTGATDLAASAAGYTRAIGSFFNDGFRVGMEVVPAGFPTNDPGVVEIVTDTLLTIRDGLTAAAVNSGRSLTVGLPLLRGWDNEGFVPTPGRPYVEEDYVPTVGALLGLIAGGTTEDVGSYMLRWYGLSNTGIPGLTKGVDALLQQFAPGNAFPIGNGDTIRIRGDLKPSRGQILPAGEGWNVIRVQIPWRLLTLNVLT